jgi:hypothetical protein
MSKGTPTPLACPSEPDERAEAFVMMKLLPQKAESFLLHMADCESCWQRVATYDKYVRAMKAAATSLRGRGVPCSPPKVRSAAS